MASKVDDVRLPFSVLDPIVGDVYSVLWEPEMMAEMGSALKILTGEILTQVGQTVLQATVMTALMSALQWPISECFPPSALRRIEPLTTNSPDKTRISDRQPVVERSGQGSRRRPRPGRYDHSPTCRSTTRIPHWLFPWRPSDLLRPCRTGKAQGVWSGPGRLHIRHDRHRIEADLARSAKRSRRAVRQCVRDQ